MALRRPGRFLPLAVAASIPLMAGRVLAEDRFPPVTVGPIAGAAAASFPPSSRLIVPMASDVRLASDELGFDRGVGPVVGRIVAWQGADYRVIAVAASDGGPTFSGGSRHAIAGRGQALLVSLRLVDPHDTNPSTAVAAR